MPDICGNSRVHPVFPPAFRHQRIPGEQASVLPSLRTGDIRLHPVFHIKYYNLIGEDNRYDICLYKSTL